MLHGSAKSARPVSIALCKECKNITMVIKTWIDYVTAIGSIATPILVLFLTGIGWKIRTKLQRKIELEDKLRNNRVEIYNEILEPFIILLMPQKAWESDKKNKNRNKDQIAVNLMLSMEYRKKAFQLSLVANDEVVKSYNDLMQYFQTFPGISESH